MADIFDELNEDLRAERARAMAKRYGLIGGIVLLLVVVGVGGWQGWKYHQTQLAAAAAGPFIEAMRQADALPPGNSPARLPVADAFAKIAATAPGRISRTRPVAGGRLRWDAGDTSRRADTVGPGECGR